MYCIGVSGRDSGRVVAEDHCHLLAKPSAEQECQIQEVACNIKPKWFATQWGEVSGGLGRLEWWFGKAGVVVWVGWSLGGVGEGVWVSLVVWVE